MSTLETHRRKPRQSGALPVPVQMELTVRRVPSSGKGTRGRWGRLTPSPFSITTRVGHDGRPRSEGSAASRSACQRLTSAPGQTRTDEHHHKHKTRRTFARRPGFGTKRSSSQPKRANGLLTGRWTNLDRRVPEHRARPASTALRRRVWMAIDLLRICECRCGAAGWRTARLGVGGPM
jgi:hypothetical protein